MALLHPSSTEAMRSEVDLWTLPSTVGNIERTRQQACKPTAGYTQSNTMTFHVPGTNALIDAAHNMLHIVAEVVKADVDVTIGNTVVSQSSLTYPYRAHIEALLGYDRSAKESHMTMRGWFKDTAGHMDDFAGDKNEGLAARRKLVKNSPKFLLPNTDLTIKLTRSADAFALMSTNKNEKIIIHDATLFFRKVELSPSLNLAHAQALEHAPARYPLTRTNVKTITIPAGLRDKTIANLHIGQIPKRIVVGFVSNIAFNGSYHHNPFNYQNFDLNYMVLYVDTEQIPAVPLTPDFSKGTYMQAYNTLFCGTGIHWKDEGNNISYDEYGNGYTLYAFDLTPDLSSHEAHWNLQKQGVVRLDVRFRAELPIAVNCVVYSEFDNLVEISKDRHVVVDYNV
ncbi:hypothetical protein KUF71_013395 [Frankliniella fusca]|uniref:Uncharacterized protein n=1 Tax=Frankliniella fusca TaxID=407009 RepID=A0AAE1HQT4_9NEOP|nr:hypothetical protein KUF71_011205 [Frankliniella fusca]KAK3925126.1 hypothetical protein KUF71_013395 [Frankliniella fusca]